MAPKAVTGLHGWFVFEGNLYNLSNAIQVLFNDSEHKIVIEYIGNNLGLEVSGSSKKEVFENYEDLVATITSICGE